MAEEEAWVQFRWRRSSNGQTFWSNVAGRRNQGRIYLNYDTQKAHQGDIREVVKLLEEHSVAYLHQHAEADAVIAECSIGIGGPMFSGSETRIKVAKYVVRQKEA